MNLSFAIAHPIPNYRWNRLAKFTPTITAQSSNLITGGNVTGGGEAEKEMGLQQGIGATVPKGDFCGHVSKVILGPSTDATDVDQLETHNFKNASSAGSQVYILEEAPDYSYTNSTDKMTLLSYGYPDGWVGYAPDDNTTRLFSFGRTIAVNQTGGTNRTSGITDPYFFGHMNVVGHADNTCSINIGKLIAGVKYVLSVRYRGDTYGTGTDISLYEGTTELAASITDLSANTWTTAETAFNISSTQSSDAHIVINHPADLTSLDELLINSISLSWGGYSSVFTGFPDYTNLIPDKGSIRVKRRTLSSKRDKSITGKYSAKETINPLSQDLPITRYSIQYNFSNIDKTDFDYVLRAIKVQEQGFLINLRPDLTGLPYCLTGRFKAQVTEKVNIFNTTKVSFNLVFEEADL